MQYLHLHFLVDGKHSRCPFDDKSHVFGHLPPAKILPLSQFFGLSLVMIKLRSSSASLTDDLRSA